MSANQYVLYPAVFDPEDDDKDILNVSFPDIPGCFTFGKGINQAMYNATEALGLMLYDEVDLPAPSDIKKVQAEHPGLLVSYVGADLAEAAKHVKIVTVKKNTTIPVDIAVKAEQAGINFSATLTEALKEKLEA